MTAGWLRTYDAADQQATASKWEAVAQKDDAARAAANAGERPPKLHDWLLIRAAVGWWPALSCTMHHAACVCSTLMSTGQLRWVPVFSFCTINCQFEQRWGDHSVSIYPAAAWRALLHTPETAAHAGAGRAIPACVLRPVQHELALILAHPTLPHASCRAGSHSCSAGRCGCSPGSCGGCSTRGNRWQGSERGCARQGYRKEGSGGGRRCTCSQAPKNWAGAVCH